MVTGSDRNAKDFFNKFTYSRFCVEKSHTRRLSIMRSTGYGFF